VFSLHHASLKPLDHYQRVLLRFFLPSSSFPGNKFIVTFSATSGCCANKYRGAEEELGEMTPLAGENNCGAAASIEHTGKEKRAMHWIRRRLWGKLNVAAKALAWSRRRWTPYGH
jgi:hypothetical protein